MSNKTIPELNKDLSEDNIYSYCSRTICSILEDVRTAHKNSNYSYLPALIEEIQYAGNRMEAAIEDIKTIEEYKTKRSKLKKEIKVLQKLYAETHGKFKE